MANNEQPTKKQFDPSEHLTQLKSKQGSQDYLEVKWRIAWFRSRYPNGTIDTEEVEVDLDRVVEAEVYVWNAEKRRSEKVIKQAKGYARFRAVATNGEGGRATGTKSETAADFPDFVEKSETGSVGRALAALGFGTQFTGDEFSEGERIVDAPVERVPVDSSGNGHTPATLPQLEPSPQQVEMRRLLDEFYAISPATYARIANWDQLALRKALDIPESGAVPSEYTDDDVARMDLYVASKRREKTNKAS